VSTAVRLVLTLIVACSGLLFTAIVFGAGNHPLALLLVIAPLYLVWIFIADLIGLLRSVQRSPKFDTAELLASGLPFAAYAVWAAFNLNWR
jgi:hypothetical protein